MLGGFLRSMSLLRRNDNYGWGLLYLSAEDGAMFQLCAVRTLSRISAHHYPAHSGGYHPGSLHRSEAGLGKAKLNER